MPFHSRVSRNAVKRLTTKGHVLRVIQHRRQLGSTTIWREMRERWREIGGGSSWWRGGNAIEDFADKAAERGGAVGLLEVAAFGGGALDIGEVLGIAAGEKDGDIGEALGKLGGGVEAAEL